MLLASPWLLFALPPFAHTGLLLQAVLFIASWQTQVFGHTFNYLWTISIYSGLGFFPFQFHWTLPVFSQNFFNCNTVCCCSPYFSSFLFFYFHLFHVSLSSLTNSGEHFSTAALSVHLHREGSKFNLSVLNAPFTWKEINGTVRLGFYLRPHTKMSSFWCTVISPSLVVSLLPVFPLKLDLRFTFMPMECTVEMIRVTSACCSGKGVVLIFRSVLKYIIFPESLPILKSCCFPLLVLPFLWLVKLDCIWTNSFITSLTFL